MLHTKLFFCFFLVYIINEVNAAPLSKVVDIFQSLVPNNSEPRHTTHHKHAPQRKSTTHHKHAPQRKSTTRHKHAPKRPISAPEKPPAKQPAILPARPPGILPARPSGILPARPSGIPAAKPPAKPTVPHDPKRDVESIDPGYFPPGKKTPTKYRAQ